MRPKGRTGRLVLGTVVGAAVLAGTIVWGPWPAPVAGQAVLDPGADAVDLIDYSAEPAVGTAIDWQERDPSGFNSPTVLRVTPDLVVSAGYTGDGDVDDQTFDLTGTDRATGKQRWQIPGTELGAIGEYGLAVHCEAVAAPDSSDPDAPGTTPVDTVLCAGEVDKAIRLSTVDIVDGKVLTTVDSTVLTDVWFSQVGGKLLMEYCAGQDEEDFDYEEMQDCSLRLVDPKTGAQLWESEIFSDFEYYAQEAELVGDYLAAEVDGEDGDPDEYPTDTLLLDPVTGKTVHRFVGSAFSLDGTSWFGTSDGDEPTLSRSTADGTVTWQRVGVEGIGGAVTLSKGIVLGATGTFEHTSDGEPKPNNNRTMVAMNAGSGEQLWERPIDNYGWVSRVFGDWMVADDQFVDLRTGRPERGTFGSVVGVSAMLVYTTDGDSLRALHRSDLSVAWKVDLDEYLTLNEDGYAWAGVVDQHLVLTGPGQAVVLDPVSGSGAT